MNKLLYMIIPRADALLDQLVVFNCIYVVLSETAVCGGSPRYNSGTHESDRRLCLDSVLLVLITASNCNGLL